MRYLYGDSTPFPLGYNFLTTIEAFMNAATRIVLLDLESSALEKQREDQAQNRVKGLEALESFHTVVMRAVQETAQKVRHKHALEYARAVADFATQHIDEHRRTMLTTNEQESVQLRGDNERRATEMREQLESFLKIARIPVVKTRLALQLVGEGKDVRHIGTAFFQHPDGLATAFKLAPAKSTNWATPRKVSDLVQGVALKVGVEKSWLRGTVTAKELGLDDWMISQIEMSEDALDLSLRRKLTEKDSLVFHVRRDEAGTTTGSVEYPDSPDAKSMPGHLGPQDVTQIERIWVALRTVTRDVVDQKEQLMNATIDAQPVFESGLALPFIVRLVALFAPVVREIAKRSPNEFELTLKVEAEGGRREENYLRKDALVSNLQPLPARGREVFAPLGLDSWVPSMTTAPPPVVASEPPRRAASEMPPVIHPSVPPPPAPSAPASSRKL